MSTSDPAPLVLEEQQLPGRSFSGPSSVPDGAPSPEFIARLANELFAALPDSLIVPHTEIPSELPSFSFSPPTTAPAFQPEIQLPSDKHFPTLPASVSPTHLAPLTVQYQAAPPAAPGALATGLDEAPDHPLEFSFLREARPISGGSYPYTGAPETLSIDVDFPLETIGFDPGPIPLSELTPLPQSLSREVPLSPAAVQSPVPVFSFLGELRPLASYPPSLPGPAPAGSGDALAESPAFDLSLPDDYQRTTEIATLAGRGSFDFLDLRRPLEPTEGQSVGEPFGIEQDVPSQLDLTAYPFDAETVKRDFPILRERVNGRPLVWLDNAATTQKPQSVIDRLTYFYGHENSNIHRAAHELAARATDAYEAARDKTRRFLNASSAQEIVFVRGATEGINLIAQSWGRKNIRKDDEIVITWLEHHANIVPWQMLCSETGAKLRVVPVDDTGQLMLDEYEKLLNPRTKLVSMTQVSNALGVITPAAQMIETAHRYGARVLLDGAQSVSHMRVDVQALDCDFFVFSGHKVFGPTGIGVVYGKPDMLEHMPPWQGGGNMIQDVTFEKTTFHGPPARFEAGTGNIADAVGLGAAIDYLDRVGMENVSRHEHELLFHATAELPCVPGLKIIGAAKEKAGVISFVLEDYRTEDVGSHLNRHGIAVRSGHHCAQPILRRFGYESTVRASLALYNTHEDIERLVRALWELRQGHTTIAS